MINRFPAVFKHDCEDCEYLGHKNNFDLYFCKRCDGGSVLARYSSEGSGYSSYPILTMIPMVLRLFITTDPGPRHNALEALVEALLDILTRPSTCIRLEVQDDSR